MTFCLHDIFELFGTKKSSSFEFDLLTENLCSRRSLFLAGIPLTFFVILYCRSVSTHHILNPFDDSFYYIIRRHLYTFFHSWIRAARRKKNTSLSNAIMKNVRCSLSFSICFVFPDMVFVIKLDLFWPWITFGISIPWSSISKWIKKTFSVFWKVFEF